MYEIAHERETPGCEKSLQDVLVSHRRLLVHVGFPDMPEGFYEQVLRQLSTVGTVVEEESFPYLSRTAVIEMRDPNPAPESGPARPTSGDQPPLGGCVTAGTARRW